MRSGRGTGWLAATAWLAAISAGACSSSHTSPSGAGGAPIGPGTGGASATGIGGAGGGGVNTGGAAGWGIGGANAGGGGGADVGGAAGAPMGGGGGTAGQAGGGGVGGGGSGGIAGSAGGAGFGGNLGLAGAPAGPDCLPLFTSGGAASGTQVYFPQVVLANLTGHGKRDLIIANTDELMTFVNDGGGHFALSGTYFPEARLSFDFTAGDLSGDGIDDVAFVADRRGQIPMGPPLLTVFLNDGKGTLTAGTYVLPEVGKSVVLGDLDGDHLPDVLVDGATMALVLPNVGAGKLGTPVALPVDSGVTAIGDLDGDGKQDLLVNVLSGLEAVINQGGWAFTPKPPSTLSVTLGFNVGQFMLVDADGDNALDVVALGRVPMVDAGSQTVVVATNDGTGVFHETFMSKVSQNAAGLGVGDFDHDGHPDVAVLAAQEANAAVDGINYFLATSGSYTAGGCRSSAVTGAVGGLKGLAAGDVNGDGRADLMIAGAASVDVLLSAAP